MAMIDISELLPRMVTAAGNEELLETAAKLAWIRVAGSGLRDQVSPFRLYRGTLIVAVADAIWQRQLHQMSGEFVRRINYMLGREVVRSIEFRIDPTVANENRAVPAPQSRRLKTPPDIVAAARAIEDPELRQRFVRAAENCIARREVLQMSLAKHE